MILPAFLLAATAGIPLASPAEVADILVVAKLCVDAAGKSRVNAVSLEKAGWHSLEESAPFVFANNNSAALIELVTDEDGGRRTCTVHAIVPERQMGLLRSGISGTFKAKMMEQSSNDDIWLFSRAGMRGIQMKVEPADGNYRVRLIAAGAL